MSTESSSSPAVAVRRASLLLSLENDKVRRSGVDNHRRLCLDMVHHSAYLVSDSWYVVVGAAAAAVVAVVVDDVR